MSGSRHFGEGEHDEPEFCDDDAPRGGGGVGLWVVHVRVPANLPGNHRTPLSPVAERPAVGWCEDGWGYDGVSNKPIEVAASCHRFGGIATMYHECLDHNNVT